MPYPIQPECYACFIKQTYTTARRFTEDDELIKHLLIGVMHYLTEIDASLSAPQIAEFIYKEIGSAVKIDDLFLPEKQKYNRIALELYPRLKELVAKASEPLQTAARLAIAGNIIDFGVTHNDFDLESNIKGALAANLNDNATQAFCRDLKTAKNIFYIGDNAGEIVFDRVFIEEIISRSDAAVIYAVRGGPIINDITREDARAVGLDKLCRIVDTGRAVPGLVLDYVAPEINELYHNADLVISKGQGNLESLLDAPGNIYFLLKIKCDCVADIMHAKTGDPIIYKGTGKIPDAGI